MIRRVAVTGGAGFIGSHFVDHLIEQGVKVRVVDNFRTGRWEFVFAAGTEEVIETDVVHGPVDDLLRAFDGCDWVVHFAANADVRHGFERPFFDLEQNGMGTARVLDAMRQVGVRNVFFASTASVYGDTRSSPITEDEPFPLQASLYGASKVYGEGLVSSYVSGYGFTGVIGRWVQIVGERYLHGHVIDFVRKLLRDPTQYEILGDGMQRKSGLYVKDLARGIWDVMNHHDGWPGAHVYNIGTAETFDVHESADLIERIMGVHPLRKYTGRRNGGWVGDNPNVLLDTSKIRHATGWAPELNIHQAITRTVEWLLSEECTYL